ncbi:MAG: AraC family transcriptional regulator [Caulobacteraceae bacterium]|nr:AraC family transcriptional regulator [Caulobacteraceae bacterium]
MTQHRAEHRARQHASNTRGIEATSIASDRPFPRHAHDSYGLGLLDRGAHRTWSPVGRVEAVAGDVITVNPEEMHDGAPVADGGRAWRMLYFDPDLVGDIAGEDGRQTLEIARPVLRDPDLRAGLETLFGRVTREGSEPLAVEEAVARVFMVVRARHSAEGPPRGASAPSVARARQRLDDDPGSPASLRELAEAAGVSRFQLVRGFARDLGVTPHAYLMQRRVRVAQRLISRGAPLARVAAEAGFADQSHMSRAFARQLGVTPARYRDAVTSPARCNILQDA